MVLSAPRTGDPKYPPVGLARLHWMAPETLAARERPVFCAFPLAFGHADAANPLTALIVSRAATVRPLKVASTTSEPLRSMLVAMENVPVVAFATTVMAAGSVAIPPTPVSATATPPLGAGPVSVIVPVEDPPARMVDGLIASDFRFGA